MISRYDPFRDALSLRRAIDQLFEQSFVHPRWFGERQEGFAPMDVYETDQGYEVHVAMPGVKPEDIDLTVHQNTLTVKGHYESRTPEGKEQTGGTQERQQGNWLMREISSGSFERTITFPRPVDVDKVQTKFEHGMLTITLPITEASRPRRISVTSGQQGQQQIPVEAGRSQGQ
jgi:HSP20 family protein